ncbi:MAG: RDD family protein [Chloroflexales bacterium]|nr:RDD family protein [Chloroflexales bacterium]
MAIAPRKLRLPGDDPSSAVPVSLVGTPAGFVSRLLALLIDVALLGGVLLVGGVIWYALLFVMPRGLSSALPASMQRLTSLLAEIIIPGVAAVIVVCGYFLFFFTVTGQTIGKRALGLRVVAADGGKLPVRRAALRLAGYVLSALPFYYGFLAMLFDARRRTWHDRLAHTLVVYAWEARPDERFLARGIARLKR